MEVIGLPLHPLIVHAVVVFVPLSALGAIAISVSAWVRKRYGWLTTAFALVATVTTFVAVRAGEDFYQTFTRPTPAMQAHMELGGGLLPWVVVLSVGALAVTVTQHLIDRGRSGTPYRIVSWAGIALSVIGAIVSVVQVVRSGHSGSNAVWGG